MLVTGNDAWWMGKPWKIISWLLKIMPWWMGNYWNNVLLNGQALKIISRVLEFMSDCMAMLRKLIYKLMG